MDISIYNPLIEFTEKNKRQALILGAISDHLFKNYEIGAIVKDVHENGRLFFDTTLMKFKTVQQAEYFYSILVLSQQVQKPGFDLFQFVTESDFTELLRKQKIGYHFDALLLINGNRIFDINIDKLIVEQPDVPDRIKHLFFENSSYHNLTSSHFLEALDLSTVGIKPEQNYITLNMDL